LVFKNIMFYILDLIFIVIFVRASRSGSRAFKKLNEDREKAFDYIDSIPDFKSTQKDIGIISGKLDKAIAMDEENQQLALITLQNHEYMHRIVSFDQIVSTEILLDEIAISKYSIKVRKLGLKITIDSISEPDFVFYSIHSKDKIAKSSIVYQVGNEIIMKWHKLITSAMKKRQ